MSDSGLALFDTPIGACGIAWLQPAWSVVIAGNRRNGGAIPAETQISGASGEAAALSKRLIAAARAASAARASTVRFASINRTCAFEASVYCAAQAVPPGRTTTYGEIAAKIGDARQARAVGQALGRNPWPIVVPCHRVTAADGRTGGFSAPGCASTKLRLLEIEGALAVDSLPLFASSS
jgi:methylated-DNA-[protein]-cysteine S-methyltransferase